MNFSNLPARLRENGLFCCWRYETRSGTGKPTKVLYNPQTGGRGQSTNPSTFTDFRTALTVMERGSYDGVGVGIFSNLGAIDIDHCIGDTGELSEMAVDIMDIMQAYTEHSPSGKGLRILFTVPDGFQYDKTRYYINNQKAGLEVYISGSTNKYVTVTGNTLTLGYDLEERGQQLASVLEKYMVRQKRKVAAPVPSGTVDMEDSALIAKIKRSKNGALFSALWSGDHSGYNSHSEADIALCNILAFWTRNDADRMDRLFRSSGLMRPKWDRKQSGSTYGTITIQNANASTQQTYDPQAHFKSKAAGITIGSASGIVKLADLHPEKNDRYGWSDIGNGNLFADWYKDIARYAPERKKWYVYTGKRWEPDTGNLHAMELCKKLADQLAIYALSLPEGALRDAYRKFVEKWQVRKNRETILKDAASVRPVSLEVFDKDPYLLNCENGTLNLCTRVFHAHTPSDMLSMLSGVAYDPDARSELWERVVNDCMQGDTEKTAFLQKAMGYGLTGDTSEECFFLLYGATSRNGKGTITDTYMKLQGDYGRTAKPDTIVQKQTANGSGPSDDIARLAGARVVNISEPDKKMVLSAALVKTLTGNDKITARFLHENSFEFYPQFKFFINTNYLPKVTDTTLFSSGRVKVIPFERHFSEAEQDKGLKKELADPQHLSGILNWCLAGLQMMQKTGFSPPAAVLSATAQYQRDSDKIARFIDDTMELNMIGEIRTEEAYREYQSWCLRNGQATEGMPTFKQSMEAYAQIKRKRPNGTGRNASPCWFICGVSWKSA